MKPDDIPQDIWDVSFNIADEWEEFDPLCIDMAKDIARAIISERERCAKVAERKWRGAPMYPDGADIAVDIRTGEQP